MNTLRNACRAAILHGNELRHIRPDRWAQTYHCTPDDIRDCFNAMWDEMWPAPNSTDATGDAK